MTPKTSLESWLEDNPCECGKRYEVVLGKKITCQTCYRGKMLDIAELTPRTIVGG